MEIYRFSYDPELDRWFLVQPMHAKRLGVGVVVVNRLLYAVGGFNGTERLASVECYHPENNEWSFVKPMEYGRSGAGVAAIKEFIYVVGGFDGVRQLSSVERYDTENQVWEQVAPIKIARSALSLTSLDGKLYAIGGFDGTNFLSIVEVYDPKTNSWELGTPLSSGRSGHASAVIYQPSCVTNFMDCIEDENSKRDNGSNDERFDNDTSNDSTAAGGSRSGDGSPGGSTSYIGFHTSFGSSGCRNCEEELLTSTQDVDCLIPNERCSKTPSAKAAIHKKLKTSWCQRTHKLRSNETNLMTSTSQSSTSATYASTDEASTYSPSSSRCQNESQQNVTHMPNVKRKCTITQCKTKCFVMEAFKKITTRNLFQDIVHCLVEKHSKKLVSL